MSLISTGASRLQMSAFESLYGGQLTLSAQSIKPNYHLILPIPTEHLSFFRNPAVYSFVPKSICSLDCLDAGLQFVGGYTVLSKRCRNKLSLVTVSLECVEFLKIWVDVRSRKRFPQNNVETAKYSMCSLHVVVNAQLSASRSTNIWCV